MRSDRIKGVLAALVALALLLSFAACMPAAVPISEPVAEAPTEAPSAETPAPTEEPEFRPLWAKTGAAQNAHSEKLPVIPDDDFSDFPVYTFYSEEQIEEALAAEHTDTHDPLYGLECLYVPENLPEGAEFEYFWVSDSYVSSFYKLASGDELRLTMQRYISTLSEYLAGAEPDCEEIQTKDCGDYLLVRCEPSRSVVWEQDGQLLELTLPETFSEDDLLGFRSACSAARVDLAPLYPAMLTFDTERDFFDAANNADENSVLYGLTGYFALYDPPAGNEKIYHMEVDAEEQLLVYGDMPDAPLFSYLRGTQPGELTSLYGPGDTAADIGNVLMVDTEYTIGGCRALYWSQGNDCFCIRYIWRASAPEFTEEQVASLCRAGFVTDPGAPEPETTPEPEMMTSGLMQVFCGGSETPVLEHFGWSVLYDPEEKQMIHETEKEEFEAQLPELHYSLPCFECGSDIDIRLAEGCEIVSTGIYDVFFRRLEEYPLTLEELIERVNSVEEETVFDIYVASRGRLVSEQEGHEVWINGYTFRVAPKDAPIVTPSPEPQTVDITPVGDTVVFDDLDLFADAVREAADDPDSVLHGLAGYYLLENGQTSAKGRFERITVTSETVEVLYSLYDIDSWDAWEGDPNRFVLTWYRNLGEADAEALVNTIVLNEPTYFGLIEEGGVWIVKSNEEEKHGVWVNDRGDVLEVTAPLIFDDPYFMLPLAKEVWVPIS